MITYNNIVRKEYTAENYRRMEEKYIFSMYYKRHYSFDEDIVIGLEKRVLINLNPEGTRVLHGYIDRLMKVGDGIYEVHDYKTSMYLPPKEQFEQDRQLALYSIAVKQMFPDAKKVYLVWHYMAFDHEIRLTRSEEELSKLKEEVDRIIQEIELAEKMNAFPPKESALCNWCVYAKYCPLFAHIYKTREMTENEYLKEPGVKLVNRYAELVQKRKEIDEEIEKIKEALFEYAKKENLEVIVGSDVKARLKIRDSIKFPPMNSEERRQLEDILKKSGKWEDISTLDTYLLSKLIKEGKLDPDLAKKIQKFQKTEQVKQIFLSKLEKVSD
ncbi:MAG: PD-(D/E)XK nuclease family protein [Candidatus Aenigmarchaeota archaeon]|nr:PD-(D/E)XK nuclease family protein [Candidatus Aenigmarchaeota archaeon]